MGGVEVKKFIGAVAIMAGTVIGVGVFGLPYVAAQAGFGVVVAYLLWGTVTAVLASLVFGELMYRSRHIHRVPGYVADYLGPRWGKLVFASATIGLLGGQLVYLLVGGHFLHQLLEPAVGGGEWAYVAAYAVAGSLIIYASGRVLAGSELLMLPVMLLTIGLIVAASSTLADWTRLIPMQPAKALLPYGVVMFSIWGISAVGETRDYLGARHARLLKPAVVASYAICAVAYLAFTASVLAATGPATTPDALGGLRQRLGTGVVAPFYLFGVLTTFTSYISIGQTIKKIFVYDAHWPAAGAWLLTATVPLALYAAGLTNFLLVMGLVGSVTLGVDSVALLAAYRRSQRRAPARVLPYRLHLRPAVLTLVAVIFIGGIISAIIQHVVLTP